MLTRENLNIEWNGYSCYCNGQYIGDNTHFTKEEYENTFINMLNKILPQDGYKCKHCGK